MTEPAEQLDPEMDRLTEALRAGPGSPQWAEATSGADGTIDEQRELLIRTRERLAAGRGYREVRPGPGFTRKVMDRVDADSTDRKAGKLSASYLAIAASGLVVGGIVLLALYLMHLGESGRSNSDPSLPVFNTTRQSASFDGPLPEGWQLIGGTTVNPSRGLVPTTRPVNLDYVGGGVMSTRPIPAGEPFSVEAVFQTTRLDDGVIPQLFVTCSPETDGDRGMTPRELVCLVRGGTVRVGLPGGDLAGPTAHVDDGQRLSLRIVVKDDGSAVVLVNGKMLWSGGCGLTDDRRFVGLRVLRKGTDKRDEVAVKFIKVMTR